MKQVFYFVFHTRLKPFAFKGTWLLGIHPKDVTWRVSGINKNANQKNVTVRLCMVK